MGGVKGDRRQLVSYAAIEVQPHQDVTVFSRFDIAATRNLTLDTFEARDVEAAAYEPKMNVTPNAVALKD